MPHTGARTRARTRLWYGLGSVKHQQDRFGTNSLLPRGWLFVRFSGSLVVRIILCF